MLIEVGINVLVNPKKLLFFFGKIKAPIIIDAYLE